MDIVALKKYDVIKDIWRSFLKDSHPYICHGINHHVHVYNNVNLILNSYKSKLEEDKVELLQIAALIHDLGRSSEITSSTNYSTDLTDALKKSFNTAQILFINNLIISHSDFIQVTNIYEAVLYLADKLDYSFQRAFLVQIFDKLVADNEDSNVRLNTDQILQELNSKTTNDINALRQLQSQYTKLDTKVITESIRNYENISHVAHKYISTYGSDIAKYKELTKRSIIDEIVNEISAAKNSGLGKTTQLLIDHIKIIKYKNNPIKVTFIKIYFWLKFLL